MLTLNQIAYFPKEKQPRATAARVWLDNAWNWRVEMDNQETS